MSVTATTPNANTAGTSPSFSDLSQSSCWTPFIYYENGRVHGLMHPCKRLDCPTCGPKKRESDLAAAQRLFDEEPFSIWVTYVREDLCDQVRKHLDRHGLPALRVPVGSNFVALFTIAPLDSWKPRGSASLPREASRLASDEEVRSVFLTHRTNKRHVRRWGRWKQSSSRSTRPKAPDYEVLAKKGIGLRTVATLGRDLGEYVHERHESSVEFKDSAGRGANFYKQALKTQEKMVRTQRMVELGHLKRTALWRFLPYGP